MLRKAIILVLTMAAVGTGVLWIEACWTGGINRWGAFSWHGSTCVVRYQVASPGPTDEAGQRPWFWHGFGYKTYTWMDGRRHLVYFPPWVPVVIFAAYPFVSFVRGPVRRWRRRKRNLCVKCAYNLTANVSGVCPECGTELNHRLPGA
jgi:hypothetical protein